jgi:hypothetical protein
MPDDLSCIAGLLVFGAETLDAFFFRDLAS